MNAAFVLPHSMKGSPRSPPAVASSSNGGYRRRLNARTSRFRFRHSLQQRGNGNRKFSPKLAQELFRLHVLVCACEPHVPTFMA